MSSHALAIAAVLAPAFLGVVLFLGLIYRADRAKAAEREQAERDEAGARQVRLAA